MPFKRAKKDYNGTELYDYAVAALGRKMPGTGLQWIWLLLIFLLPASTLCRGQEISFECGAIAHSRTEVHRRTYSIRNNFAKKVIVRITATNNGDENSPSCDVTWSVAFVNSNGSVVHVIKKSEEPDEDLIGNEKPVLSADGTKLMIIFWGAAGDYTGYRIAVYDFASKRNFFRTIADRVTHDLPTCDYSTLIDGITNRGEVVIHVPKSIYVDEGCPDQGKWLLDMKTDKLTRLSHKHETSKTHAQR